MPHIRIISVKRNLEVGDADFDIRGILEHLEHILLRSLQIKQLQTRP
jgi:hypothetical protein